MGFWDPFVAVFAKSCPRAERACGAIGKPTFEGSYDRDGAAVPTMWRGSVPIWAIAATAQPGAAWAGE